MARLSPPRRIPPPVETQSPTQDNPTSSPQQLIHHEHAEWRQHDSHEGSKTICYSVRNDRGPNRHTLHSGSMCFGSNEARSMSRRRFSQRLAGRRRSRRRNSATGTGRPEHASPSHAMGHAGAGVAQKRDRALPLPENYNPDMAAGTHGDRLCSGSSILVRQYLDCLSTSTVTGNSNSDDTFAFVGDQKGRWRVTAFNGTVYSSPSAWTFSTTPRLRWRHRFRPILRTTKYSATVRGRSRCPGRWSLRRRVTTWR